MTLLTAPGFWRVETVEFGLYVTNVGRKPGSSRSGTLPTGLYTAPLVPFFIPS